jgi:Ni,Fe-hydrogenase maturation factor
VILLGGVGQLWQGDLDLGRRAAELLAVEFADRDDVVVEDLYYGAVAVAQRLEELSPAALVLVGADRRGRPAGTVEVRRIGGPLLSPGEVQAAVGDAVTGYVAIDLLVQVAQGLGALPESTTVVEVEPAATEPSEQMSAEAEQGLTKALAAVRAEVVRHERSQQQEKGDATAADQPPAVDAAGGQAPVAAGAP